MTLSLCYEKQSCLTYTPISSQIYWKRAKKLPQVLKFAIFFTSSLASSIFCGKRHLLEFLASGGRLSCHFWSTVTHCDTQGRRCMGYTPSHHASNILYTCFNITFNIFKNILVSQKYTQTHSRMGYPPRSYKQHTLRLRTKWYEHMYMHILK